MIWLRKPEDIMAAADMLLMITRGNQYSLNCYLGFCRIRMEQRGCGVKAMFLNRL